MFPYLQYTNSDAGKAFGLQYQIMDAKEKRRKCDRERYARMNNEEKLKKLKKLKPIMKRKQKSQIEGRKDAQKRKGRKCWKNAVKPITKRKQTSRSKEKKDVHKIGRDMQICTQKKRKLE
jgi:hypothetical protein